MRSRGVAALTAASLLTTVAGVAAAAAPASAGTSTSTSQPTSQSGTARITGDAVPGAEPAARRAAPGGTIVLIKNHNVWLVRPDGSGLTRVTSDGTAATPYEKPTMSDTGIIAVTRGDTIHLLKQNGQAVGAMKPRDLFLPDSATIWTTPILDPVISPDGSRIAYSQLRAVRDFEGKIRTQSLTGFADSDGNGAPKYTIQLGYEPSWINRNRAVINGNGDADLYTLGEQEKANWFRGDDVMPEDDDPFIWYEVSEPEVSPDRRYVTFMLAGGRAVALAKVNGDPAATVPPAPDLASCFVNEDEPIPEEPSFDTPSWGPDSRSVAFESPEGVQVVTDFDLCGDGAGLETIVPGGSEPDWADTTLNPGPAAFTLDRKPAVTGTPKAGKTLTASAGGWTPAPTSVKYQWLRDGKALKGATGRTYVVRKTDKGHSLAVRVTVARNGYRAASAESAARQVR